MKKRSMSLNFDQGPSSRKQIYNQSILDILTPSYKESSLNTPDVNKCVLNSPETERVIRDFNLESSYLYPGLLSPSLFQFSLPHFSPNLHSPKLHSPNLNKLNNTSVLDSLIKDEKTEFAANQSSMNISNNSSEVNLDQSNNQVHQKNKVEDKKAKNRAAALRCKKRKQDRVNFLEEQVKFLNADNMKLSRSERLLYDENNRLKQHLSFHLSNGCNLGQSSYSMISK